MLKPETMNLKQAWNALREAKKGNGISQAIYQKWAERNAMPIPGDPEIESLKTYEEFTKYHVKVWYME
jgi:hypothetical protein